MLVEKFKVDLGIREKGSIHIILKFDTLYVLGGVSLSLSLSLYIYLSIYLSIYLLLLGTAWPRIQLARYRPPHKYGNF